MLRSARIGKGKDMDMDFAWVEFVLGISKQRAERMDAREAGSVISRWLLIACR